MIARLLSTRMFNTVALHRHVCVIWSVLVGGVGVDERLMFREVLFSFTVMGW